MPSTSDTYLKIDTIDGESTDSKHAGAIEVSSFSWGVSNSGHMGSSAGGGGGRGKSTFQDVQFTTQLSKASPKLMLACATGQHIKKAELFLRKPGGEQEEFYKITLSDCLVSGYSSSGADGAGVPQESFSLNFAKLEVEYKGQKADGTVDSPTKAGYDLAKNTKV